MGSNPTASAKGNHNMDEALAKALNDLADELGLKSLDEILNEPEHYTYNPDRE